MITSELRAVNHRPPTTNGGPPDRFPVVVAPADRPVVNPYSLNPYNLDEAPAFPAGALSPWARRFAVEVARDAHVPVDMPGVLVLGAVATALGNVHRVIPRQGWRGVPTNLFLMEIAAPGEAKSIVVSRCREPLDAYEERRIEREAHELARLRVEYEQKRQRLEQLKRDLSSGRVADPDDATLLRQEAADLAVELDRTPWPEEFQLFESDATTESLILALREQYGHVAVFDDEGYVLRQMAAPYAKDGQGNIGVYLSGFDGARYRGRTIKRGKVKIPSVLINISLAVQESVASGVVSNGDFRGTGLVARFAYSWPVPLEDLKPEGSPPIDEAVVAAYGRKMADILAEVERRAARLPRRPDGWLAEYAVLRFDDAAEAALDRWHRANIATRRRSEMAYMADWLGKIEMLVARLAAVLHVMDHAGRDGGWPDVIERDAVIRAIQLAEYFLGHTVRVLRMADVDPSIEAAQHVLAWAEREGAKRAGAGDRAPFRFTRGDAYDALRRGRRFKTSRDLDAPLAVLVQSGDLRRLDEAEYRKAGPGRPPAGGVFELVRRGNATPMARGAA